MKLTGNISIQSIIYFVRIDLLTSWRSDTRTFQMEHSNTAGKWSSTADRPSLSRRSIDAYQILRSRWTDFDISDSHTR